MPLYEYKCAACAHEFEEVQKFSDKPIKKCPVCGKLKVAKKVSRAGFQLKGSGWYKDGYSKPDTSGGDKKPATATPEKSDKKDKSKAEPAAVPTPKESSTKSANTKNQAA